MQAFLGPSGGSVQSYGWLTLAQHLSKCASLMLDKMAEALDPPLGPNRLESRRGKVDRRRGVLQDRQEVS